MFLSFRKKQLFPQNLSFNNIYSGQDCFILATGPSINLNDLSALKNQHIITVSNFFVHPLIKELNPLFHVFAETHFPITPDQALNWFLDANNKLDVNTKIFCSIKDLSIAQSSFKGRTVHYYQYGGNFPLDLTKAIPPVQTVVHIAIYLAAYLGFKKIYLLGVDHDSILDFGKSRHFYKEDESQLVNSGYDEWENIDLENEFYAHYILWKTYKDIKKNVRASVINLNVKSFLDVFEKKSLQEVIQKL